MVVTHNLDLEVLRLHEGCMGTIHPSAIIEDGAEIGENVSIGAYSIVGAQAKLGVEFLY